jgi:hypothetical protein
MGLLLRTQSGQELIDTDALLGKFPLRAHHADPLRTRQVDQLINFPLRRCHPFLGIRGGHIGEAIFADLPAKSNTLINITIALNSFE